jgi:hypothetical protein
MFLARVTDSGSVTLSLNVLDDVVWDQTGLIDKNIKIVNVKTISGFNMIALLLRLSWLKREGAGEL